MSVYDCNAHNNALLPLVPSAAITAAGAIAVTAVVVAAFAVNVVAAADDDVAAVFLSWQFVDIVVAATDIVEE